MKISVIIQSYLEPYRGSATNQEYKFKRAIDSVLQQTYENIEIIVIADGCHKTVNIVKENYINKLQCYYMAKQRNWSGAMRNCGIDRATGDYIIYLDTDDYFGVNHVQNIVNQIDENKVYFFDDYIVKNNVFNLRNFAMSLGRCGTSNICHKRDIPERWDIVNMYGNDDWKFIKKLKKYNNKKINNSEYYVCHIPKTYDL